MSSENKIRTAFEKWCDHNKIKSMHSLSPEAYEAFKKGYKAALAEQSEEEIDMLTDKAISTCVNVYQGWASPNIEKTTRDIITTFLQGRRSDGNG
jgi:uncharacterized protein YeaO (DUF488 family)